MLLLQLCKNGLALLHSGRDGFLNVTWPQMGSIPCSNPLQTILNGNVPGLQEHCLGSHDCQRRLLCNLCSNFSHTLLQIFLGGKCSFHKPEALGLLAIKGSGGEGQLHCVVITYYYRKSLQSAQIGRDCEIHFSYRETCVLGGISTTTASDLQREFLSSNISINGSKYTFNVNLLFHI